LALAKNFLILFWLQTSHYMYQTERISLKKCKMAAKTQHTRDTNVGYSFIHILKGWLLLNKHLIVSMWFLNRLSLNFTKDILAVYPLK